MQCDENKISARRHSGLGLQRYRLLDLGRYSSYRWPRQRSFVLIVAANRPGHVLLPPTHSRWPNNIVMIDDFKIPFDDGFGWDCYDDDREICMRYIDGAIAGKPIFFPAYSAASEGRFARGFCVIKPQL